MTVINFSWPKNLNLDILAEVLSEGDLLRFIAEHVKEPLVKRTITLPSTRICKKVLAHQLWCRILAGQMTWERYLKSLRREHGSMKKSGLRKDKIIKLYQQRQKEILEGK